MFPSDFEEKEITFIIDLKKDELIVNIWEAGSQNSYIWIAISSMYDDQYYWHSGWLQPVENNQQQRIGKMWHSLDISVQIFQKL